MGTDGQTDGRTKRGVESRSTQLKSLRRGDVHNLNAVNNDNEDN